MKSYLRSTFIRLGVQIVIVCEKVATVEQDFDPYLLILVQAPGCRVVKHDEIGIAGQHNR